MGFAYLFLLSACTIKLRLGIDYSHAVEKACFCFNHPCRMNNFMHVEISPARVYSGWNRHSIGQCDNATVLFELERLRNQCGRASAYADAQFFYLCWNIALAPSAF